MSTKDPSSWSGNDSDHNIEKAVADQLSARIGSDRFELWFNHPNTIRYASLDRGIGVWVFAENSFALQRIQNTFGREIRSVVDRVCGPHCDIRFEVIVEVDASKDNDETVANKVDATNTAPANSDRKIQTELNLQDDDEQVGIVDIPQNGQPVQTVLFPSLELKTSSKNVDSAVTVAGRDHSQSATHGRPRTPKRRGLDSFWFGEENRLTEVGAQQLFRQPGQFSPFFIYGPSGCGKSHLVESIVNDYRRKLKRRRCVLLSAEQFTSLFVSSLRGGSGLPMFRRKYRDLDLLAIDDIQFLAGKTATMNEFQHTIDNLIRNGKQVVVTSDRPPLELGGLGGELGTRLTAGLSCPLRYPGMEGRIKIAQRFCKERNLSLSNNVLEMLCHRLTRDVRRLSGALNRLHAVAVSTGSKITPEIAQNELCELFAMSSGNSTTMLNIETAVCDFCGIKPAELKSSSRRKQISTARMLAMYLSREYTASALSEIGDYFGGRSHSTVIAAKRKVSSWLENNDGVALAHATYPAKEVINRIESNLRIG